MPTPLPPLEERLPTRWGALVFLVKAFCFQARRRWVDLSDGPRRYTPRDHDVPGVVLGSRRSDLWHEAAAPGERRLQLGKVQNLRVAARALHGITVPAGETFSFWRQVGRATRRRGFAVGRELREGCLVPTIGGGLCQLSGALYAAALEAGLEIVERHAHSHPGVSAAAQVGRDATVFWNYVDLRLRAPFPWRLEVCLSGTHLEVRIFGEQAPKATRPAPAQEGPPTPAVPLPNSCASCGIDDCFRHQGPVSAPAEGTAWLVDDCWPEFARLLREERPAAALLCQPLDGKLWRKPAYAWSRARFAQVRMATGVALRRAWSVRGLRAQGAVRQMALLAWDERLATAYQRHLKEEHTHLVIAQSLLPYLWRDGVLGGRTFEVLMQRVPLAELHATLNRAAGLHPASHTCGDFRAPVWLVQAETEALAAAARWITPHAEVARLAGERVRLLAWETHVAKPRRSGGLRVVFPASTLCRKGAYELRAAARELALEVVCLGGVLEGADFWSGVRLAEPGEDWLAGAAAVVLPAFVEHRPRRLLEALAAGVPVIATTACGLLPSALLTAIPAGDAAELVKALRRLPALAGVEVPAGSH